MDNKTKKMSDNPRIITYSKAKKILKNAKKSIKKIFKEKGKEYLYDIINIKFNSYYYSSLIDKINESITPKEKHLLQEKYKIAKELDEHLRSINHLYDFGGVNYYDLKKEIQKNNSISHIINCLYHVGESTTKYYKSSFYNIPELKVEEVQILNAVSDVDELKRVKVIINNPEEDIPKIIESADIQKLIYCKNIIKIIVENQDSITNFILSRIKEYKKNKTKLNKIDIIIHSLLCLSKTSEYYKKFNKDEKIKFSFVEAIPFLPTDMVRKWLLNYEYANIFDDKHIALLILKIMDSYFLKMSDAFTALRIRIIITKRLNSKVFQDTIVKNLNGKKKTKAFLEILKDIKASEHLNDVSQLISRIQTTFLFKYGKDCSFIGSEDINIAKKILTSFEELYNKVSSTYKISYDKIYSLMSLKILKEYLKKGNSLRNLNKVVDTISCLICPNNSSSINLITTHIQYAKNEKILDIIFDEINQEFGFFDDLGKMSLMTSCNDSLFEKIKNATQLLLF